MRFSSCLSVLYSQLKAHGEVFAKLIIVEVRKLYYFAGTKLFPLRDRRKLVIEANRLTVA